MKKVRRDGKWVTIDKDGKVIDAAYRKKKGKEFRKKIDDYRSEQLKKLRIGVQEFGKNLVYSDDLDEGNLQTVAQAENKQRQLAIKDDSFSAFRGSQRRDPKEFETFVYKDPANEAANDAFKGLEGILTENPNEKLYEFADEINKNRESLNVGKPPNLNTEVSEMAFKGTDSAAFDAVRSKIAKDPSRIQKGLIESGFTADRLAALVIKNRKFQANKRNR
mgnify:CR=1 FL=1|tara:strand:+ start:43 stop:702 length:660 start_codon:yes stop_codon:yes gene_type:complete